MLNLVEHHEEVSCA